MTLDHKIRVSKSGTAAEWAAEDPVLAEAEWGLDTTNELVKIGNGADTWSDLPSLPGGPRCKVYQAVAPTLTTGTQTVLAFANERWDVGGMHDNASDNSRLTAPVAGLYMVGACIPFDTDATGRRTVILRKTAAIGAGTDLFVAAVEQAVASSVTVVNVTGEVQLAEDDYVECIALQASGGDLDLSIQDYGPSFWARKVA